MEDIFYTVNAYRERYEIIGRAHYIAWDNAARKNKWIGIPVVITSTIVGTAIFSTIKESPNTAWKITAGLLLLFAAVLSTLQTILKYSELAEKHKSAGTKYHDIRRDLDYFVLKYSSMSEPNREKVIEEFESIKKKISELAEASPSIPDKFYNQATDEIKNKGKSFFTMIYDKDKDKDA